MGLVGRGAYLEVIFNLCWKNTNYMSAVVDFFTSPDFIAGSVAGSAGIIATQPLDTIRIRKQLFKAQKMSALQHFTQV